MILTNGHSRPFHVLILKLLPLLLHLPSFLLFTTLSHKHHVLIAFWNYFEKWGMFPLYFASHLVSLVPLSIFSPCVYRYFHSLTSPPPEFPHHRISVLTALYFSLSVMTAFVNVFFFFVSSQKFARAGHGGVSSCPSLSGLLRHLPCFHTARFECDFIWKDYTLSSSRPGHNSALCLSPFQLTTLCTLSLLRAYAARFWPAQYQRFPLLHVSFLNMKGPPHSRSANFRRDMKPWLVQRRFHFFSAAFPGVGRLR